MPQSCPNAHPGFPVGCPDQIRQPALEDSSENISAKNQYLADCRLILCRMIQNMTTAEQNDSISHNFIVRMIPHHQAAIELSNCLLRSHPDAALGSLASRIITQQTEGILHLQNLLAACDTLSNSPEDLCVYQIRANQSMEDMFSRMTGALSGGGNFFLDEMLPHQEGAVHLSENALRFRICPDLVPVLENIILTRMQAIREMKELLRSREE